MSSIASATLLAFRSLRVLVSRPRILPPCGRHDNRCMLNTSLAGQDVTRLIKAIREARFGGQVKCPRCQSTRVWRWGQFSGRQRYRCRECRRTFNDLTGTPVAWSKCLARLPAYRDNMRASASLRVCARAVGCHLTTSFRWRHRLLNGALSEETVLLNGFVEVAETRVLCVDTRRWKRQRRSIVHARDQRSWILGLRDRSGRSAMVYTGEEVPREFWWHLVLKSFVEPPAVIVSRRARRLSPVTSAARAAKLSVQSATAGRPTGASGMLSHTDNAGALLLRFRRWLDRFRGVSTRYLDNYVQWFGMLDPERRTAFRLDQLFDWPLRPPEEPDDPQQSQRTDAEGSRQ
ncbi:MAG TPA: IS1 family transposase [Longimicrobiales bacterium]|nr:IS1 family transposase [Longimicrobiales bacterium]